MSVRPRKPAQVSLSKAAAYDTILRPIVTEKATMANENGQVTFAVPVTATKPEIKAAVELLFDGFAQMLNLTASPTLSCGRSSMLLWLHSSGVLERTNVFRINQIFTSPFVPCLRFLSLRADLEHTARCPRRDSGVA